MREAFRKAKQHVTHLKDDAVERLDRLRSRSQDRGGSSSVHTRPSTPNPATIHSANSSHPEREDATASRNQELGAKVQTPAQGPTILVSPVPETPNTSLPIVPIVAAVSSQSHESGAAGSSIPSCTHIASSTAEEKNSTAHAMWMGVKTLLSTLEESAAAFGPLKSAISGINNCIDIFEMQASTQEDYARLRTDLNNLCLDMCRFIKGDTPPAMTSIVLAIARGINKETQLVQEKQRRGKVISAIEAREDPETIARSYSRIHELLNRLNVNVNMNTWKIVDRLATKARLDGLLPSSAAVYCSAESLSLRRNACTPNTRVDVLQSLKAWAHDPTTESMYWLNGMAGTGKTTIAYSLCKELENSGVIVASFFCSRQLPSCRDVNKILPSIAYQLATFSYPFRCALSDALDQHPDADKQELPKQLRVLIVEPLTIIAETLPGDLVIVIDALDECRDEVLAGQGSSTNDAVSGILTALIEHVSELPVKLCVTSRPEPIIVEKMRGERGTKLKLELRLHDLDHGEVERDIREYITTELALHALPEHQLDELIKRSGVLFVYASTIVRYLGPRKSSWSIARLDRLFGAGGSQSNSSHKEIDGLYEMVLSSALESEGRQEWEAQAIQAVLNLIICSMEPLTLDAIVMFAEERADLIDGALQALSSVVNVSESTGLVTTLHESFPDFVLDKSRSNRFHCDSSFQNEEYARLCFRMMNAITPPFNICGLKSSFSLDADVEDLDERIESKVPTGLIYACRYWVNHMKLSRRPASLMDSLMSFLSERLLLWMEIMNLKKYKYAGAQLLHELESWLATRETSKEVHRLAQDAWRFAAEFANSGSSESTPHLYISALALWPKDREISRVYSSKVNGLVQVSGTAMSHRMRAPITTWKLNASVVCLAYSPSGKDLVAGFMDGTVCIWNAYTGEISGQPLMGHEEAVYTVAYSPDGTRIASGSADNTVRIWDARTRLACGEPCTGHTGTVYSVAYSPNGKHLASGSGDSTIRLWDACTCQLSHMIRTNQEGEIYSVGYSPDSVYIASGLDNGKIFIWEADSGEMNGSGFAGHTEGVWSVMYSPDGVRLVSCSVDKTLRIWDVKSGAQLGDPLVGHGDSIIRAAQSCDGKLIASTSNDKTVRVWDYESREVVGHPLMGHTGGVWALAFSPSGQYIASGSEDKTICIWDVNSASVHDQPSHGHLGSVYSVTCSPSGRYFASGSADRTIRMWDIRTGQLHGQPLEGHTDEINAVAYSPDGNYIASGSDDRTVRIWNALTGEMHGKPLEGHTGSVLSVAYSPDGAYLASGSEDKTVIIWNTHTGDMNGQPLQGHTDYVREVAYSPDSVHLASGSDDRTIHIWNTSTGQIEGDPLEGHTSHVMAVAYSPDGAYIVSGSLDKTIRVWNAHSRTKRGQPLTGHTDGVRCVAYSPNGAHIISGSDDCTIRIWDAQTGASCGQYQGHTDFVRSVACSADGAYIISGSDDQTVRIWEMVKHESASGLQSHKVSTHEPQPNWRLDAKTGWVVRNDGARLVWLPPDTRLVYGPPGVHVLSNKGFLKIDFTDALLGENWAKCYRV
ncbi:Vegetative incompatibility protein HET-E-1 [Ceratobasidium sp. AG-Ba]|nr:Vegetative incompatibility protein HET-E-1 [Ceratobasidium sp. AG-Ba]